MFIYMTTYDHIWPYGHGFIKCNNAYQPTFPKIDRNAKSRIYIYIYIYTHTATPPQPPLRKWGEIDLFRDPFWMMLDQRDLKMDL